jgi:hypothetical protein
MDRITPSQASILIEALRKLGKSREATHAGSNPPAESADVERSTIRDELKVLIAGVDIESDAGLRAIQAPVLRCILQKEWGRDASSDPAFAGVVTALDQSFTKDPRLTQVIRDALRALREAKG